MAFADLCSRFCVFIHVLSLITAASTAIGSTVQPADHGQSQLPKPQLPLPELRLSPLGASTVAGMDVSSYQGNVNWTAAFNKGARFAYVKATEGTSYINPYFSQQYGGSLRAGMIRGAYHFARPNRSGGAAQANYFLAHGGRWSRDGKTLPGALDIEYNPNGATCYGLTQRQMGAWISAFVSTYRSATGVSPVIYSTYDWYNRCVGRSGDFSASCPFWIACYCSGVTSLPYNWKRYTIWQHADHGTFPGDQNLFNGSIEGLRALANGTHHALIHLYTHSHEHTHSYTFT